MSKKIFKGFADVLNVNKIRIIAFESGFARRMWKKISPESFFLYTCLESIKGTVSHNDLAVSIGLTTGKLASRQAYHERINNKADIFMQKLLEEVIKKNIITVI